MDTADKLLKFLQFKVVRRLDGILQGDYTGVFYGPGMELGEVREYQLGDDVRRIDWNVTARTTRVHVRQYIEEREITAWLLVDRSPSIDFGTTLQSKHDLVTEFVGLMAHLYTRHGNRVGMVTFSSEIDRVIPPAGGRLQTLRLISALQNPGAAAFSGTTNLAAVLERAHRFLRRRSLVFVISDFIVPSGWERHLQLLAQRHDVVVVHVVDPRERELPDIGLLRLEDPETGEQLWIDTSHKPTRERFRTAVAERDRRLSATLASAAVDLVTLSTAEPLIEPLLRFVALRKRRRPWVSLGR
ncbi:MAG: DUF58 domain-containing protein [Chloroflexota bacterium]|nr:DUF58 domain-containing protein [Dehalococcoidia bacterium]MDW8254562.1 DUF58 domain-containing protein [Chloroflexota bacterium]